MKKLGTPPYKLLVKRSSGHLAEPEQQEQQPDVEQQFPNTKISIEKARIESKNVSKAMIKAEKKAVAKQNKKQIQQSIH